MNLKAGENERTDYRCMLMLKNKLASMMLSVNQTLCFSPPASFSSSFSPDAGKTLNVFVVLH